MSGSVSALMMPVYAFLQPLNDVTTAQSLLTLSDELTVMILSPPLQPTASLPKTEAPCDNVCKEYDNFADFVTAHCDEETFLVNREVARAKP